MINVIIKHYSNKKAFTIMELIIVVIILGVVTAFAIPNYSKSIRKAHARDTLIQLSTIHAANILYFSQTNQYAPQTSQDLVNLNTELDLNIIANNMLYTYSRPTVSTYTVTSQWIDGSNNFTITLNQNILKTTAPNPNPCCSAGTCFVVPDC